MISKEMQEKIIDLFCNTETSVGGILKKVDTNNETSLEEIYDFIENYRTKEGKRLTRQTNKKKSFEFLKEEIYELRKKGLTYDEITEYFKGKGIDVNISAILKRCREIYMEKDEKQNARKSVKSVRRFDDDISNIIFELRDKNYTYEQIYKHLKKLGVNISLTTIGCKCKVEYYNREHKDEYESARKNNARKNDPFIAIRKSDDFER